MCTFLTWHFDQMAKDFLEEDVGVAEVLTDTAIWLMRFGIHTRTYTRTYTHKIIPEKYVLYTQV